MKKIIFLLLFSCFAFAGRIVIGGPTKAYVLDQLKAEVISDATLTNAFLDYINFSSPNVLTFSFLSNLDSDQTNALYLAVTNHSANLNTVNLPIPLYVSGTDAYTNSLALGTFYQMANGAWRMRFTVSGRSATDDHIVITISNLMFATAFSNGQAIALTTKSTGFGTQAWANPGTNTIEGVSIDLLSFGSATWSFAGDVALQSKPVGYLP